MTPDRNLPALERGGAVYMHKVILLGTRVVNLTSGGYGGMSFHEISEKSDYVGVVVCFRNEAIYGQRVESIHNAKAHLKLFDQDGAEIGTGISRACWLGEKADMVELSPGGGAACVLAIVSSKYRSTVPYKRRVRAGFGGDIVKDESLDLENLPHTIEISLLDTDNQLLLPPIRVGLILANGTLTANIAPSGKAAESTIPPEENPEADMAYPIIVVPQPVAGELQEAPSRWTRDQKIAATALVIALVAALIGITTPEIRKRIGLEHRAENIVINGMVVDRDTNRGIPQAAIYAVGRPEQYTTEDNGNFRINLLPDTPKLVRLHVTKPGFLPLDQSIEAPADGIILQLQKR